MRIVPNFICTVLTGRIRECWCPILYKVAVHHVSRYVKENTDKSAQLLHSRIVSLGNQVSYYHGFVWLLFINLKNV